MNRSKRKTCAKETLAIIEQGYYTNLDGERIEIGSQLAKSGSETVVYDTLLEVNRGASFTETEITLTNETTFDAVRRLSGLYKSENIVCLNFASAKNPGGGFLNGSQAQEEALARSSSLYASLRKGRRYYDENRAATSAFYKNLVIYSPDITIFKLENGDLMKEPVCCNIITAPAVNVGGLEQQQALDVQLIEQTMRERMQLIFNVALKHHADCLILGAWGCGVFQQNPRNVARWFQEELNNFNGYFRRVHFAVLDTSTAQETFDAFKKNIKTP